MKTHAGENLILGAARRSIRCTDILVLGNGATISTNKPDCEISRIATLILDLIVKPLRDIQINDYEFACLKAIVFFDPGISLIFEIKISSLSLESLIRKFYETIPLFKFIPKKHSFI